MNALRKRVFEEMIGMDMVKVSALGKEKNEYVKHINKFKKQCIRDEKAIKKKKEKLEKAREAVAKLEGEIEKAENNLKSNEESKEKILNLVKDIDLEVEDSKRRLMLKARPLVEEDAEGLGIHIESEGECSVCMDIWPFVFNACISENCKYVICLECYEKCKGKCPNCRKKFIK